MLNMLIFGKFARVNGADDIYWRPIWERFFFFVPESFLSVQPYSTFSSVMARHLLLHLGF